MSSATSGLEGVIAAESSICWIDPIGVLAYRGYNIDTLAKNASFEETAFLLWHGQLPNAAELDDLKRQLVHHRGLPREVHDLLRGLANARPMDVLRTAVSFLGALEPRHLGNTPAENRARSLRLLAQISTIVTTFDRLRKDSYVVEGDPKLGYAANFLYCLTGRRPDTVSERALDIALILHADHEFNASTFAGRVTAATLSDIFSAVTSAIGALKGPLHGGANEDVIRLLLETGGPERGAQAVREMIAAKKKLPGFGHRVYRTEDPRATHLRAISEDLGNKTGHADLYQTSRAIEETFRQLKPDLYPNVDFYSASAYYSMGIPVDLFTPVFAISRMSGWTAHILEQLEHNRLIRPRSEYHGVRDGLAWIPVDKR